MLLKRAAMYTFSQLLQSGHSVIYDVNSNKRKSRKELAKFAKEYGVEFRLIWLQVDDVTAKQRVNDRAAAAIGDEAAYYNGFREDLVDYMKAKLQTPSESERFIAIDGLADYVVQKQQFMQQFTKHP